MNELLVDQRIADLLDDPLISLLIRADKVDRGVLADNLRNLTARRENAKGRSLRAVLSQPRSLRARVLVAPSFVTSAVRAEDLCRSCAK